MTVVWRYDSGIVNIAGNLMRRVIIRCLVFGLPVMLGACQAARPDFPTTESQHTSLQEIVMKTWLDVKSDLPSYRDRQEVEQLLRTYDSDIRTILDDAQWVNYETNERAYWVDGIFRTARKERRQQNLFPSRRSVCTTTVLANSAIPTRRCVPSRM